MKQLEQLELARALPPAIWMKDVGRLDKDQQYLLSEGLQRSSVVALHVSLPPDFKGILYVPKSPEDTDMADTKEIIVDELWFTVLALERAPANMELKRISPYEAACQFQARQNGSQ